MNKSSFKLYILTTLALLATSVQADSFEAILTADVLQSNGQYVSCDGLVDHCASQGMKLANLNEVLHWLQTNSAPCAYDQGNCKAVTSDFTDDSQLYRVLYSTYQGSFGHPDTYCANTDRYFVCKMEADCATDVNPDEWQSSWGACSTYAEGGKNEGYCSDVGEEGKYNAFQVCSECDRCFPTGLPNVVEPECSWTEPYPECYGADIQEVYGVASLEECQAGCEAYAGCKFITWGNGRCIYKNGDGTSPYACWANWWQSGAGCDSDGYCANTGYCDSAYSFCGSNYVCSEGDSKSEPTTNGPSSHLSMSPSFFPSSEPTTESSSEPTESPTSEPTRPVLETPEPSLAATTLAPTVATMEPTTETPTGGPTVATMEPTTGTPTRVPTVATMEPTSATFEPTVSTMEPSANLVTSAPTNPTKKPTKEPVTTENPSVAPSSNVDTAPPETTRKPLDKPEIDIVHLSVPSDSPTEATARPSSAPAVVHENNVQYIVEKETIPVHTHVFYLMFLMLFCCLCCGVAVLLCRPQPKSVIPSEMKNVGTKTPGTAFPEVMETAWNAGEAVETRTIAPTETSHVVLDFTTPVGDAGEGVVENEESEGGLYLDERDSVLLYPEVKAAIPTNGSYLDRGMDYIVTDEPEGHQQTTSARAQMHRANELA